jgi:filamentous hemagglutinin family protein
MINKYIFIVVLAGFFGYRSEISAQIIPDRSLPRNTTVSSEGNLSTITGGTTRGNNLFHSFKQFSLPTGTEARFNNPSLIQNIFSRVTGKSISNIDGLISANGNANFFLINPNGIIFGSNASLNIGGSFLASTADNIVFADGFKFSAKNPSGHSLLTISVPIGLGFIGNSGEISINGQGHSLLQETQLDSPPIGIGESLNGLRPPFGKSIVLAADGITFKGGLISLLSGNIAIASVEKGVLSFNAETFLLNNNNSKIEKFNDVKFLQRSLIDLISYEGEAASNILVKAGNVHIADGSLLILTNSPNSEPGTIEFDLSGDFVLQGVSEFNKNQLLSLDARDLSIPRGILSLSLAEKGSNILIDAKNITIGDSGLVGTLNLLGEGGDVTLRANNSIQVLGKSPVDPLPLGSFIFTGVGDVDEISFDDSTRKGGDINLSATDLLIQNGSVILTTSFSRLQPSQAGSLTGNILNSIKVSGAIVEPDGFFPTLLGSGAVRAGNAGNVWLEAKSIFVGSGARIDSTTAGSGDTGDSIVVRARESITVSGKNSSTTEVGQILSSARLFNQLFNRSFELDRKLTGNSGNLLIEAPRIELVDGGRIGVQNEGSGQAGNLNINSSFIVLDNASQFSATTLSGRGGNININSSNLRLNDNSAITATAGGTGNGGDITINTDFLLAFNNSKITANAFGGRGGNIQINAQNVFRSPNSNFSASSQLSVDGTVDINTFDDPLENDLAQVRTDPLAAEQIIVQSCLMERNQQRGSFVVTGTGGMPASPKTTFSEFPVSERLATPEAGNSSYDRRTNERVWLSSIPRRDSDDDPIIESSGMIQSPDGTIALVAEATSQEIEGAEYLICR